MAEKKKLVLGHMFLYAKGWYRHTRVENANSTLQNALF
jgi:hypothetical protein